VFQGLAFWVVVSRKGYLATFINQPHRLDNFRSNLSNTAIPAYKLLGSRTQDGLDFLQIFAIKDNKVYTILYSSERTRYSTYLPIIEEIINSFEVR
jgi:hypothetical protein